MPKTRKSVLETFVESFTDVFNMLYTAADTSDIENDLSDVTSTVESLSERVDSLSDSVGDLDEASIASITERLDDLEYDVKDLCSKVTNPTELNHQSAAMWRLMILFIKTAISFDEVRNAVNGDEK